MAASCRTCCGTCWRDGCVVRRARYCRCSALQSGIGMFLGGWVALTLWGAGYILLQAATVALWAQLQRLWLRHNRSRPSMAF